LIFTENKLMGEAMQKILFIFLSVSLFCAPALSWGLSESATKLRAQNALEEFAPQDSFLNGNFVADEVDPRYIFGKVKDFVEARSCPTSWLIETGEKNRLKGKDNQSGPMEYTLYLEEDCPGRIMYFIFVDRSQEQSVQWMEWRKQFHKNKAEGQYGEVNALLQQAAQDGYPVDGELRFIEIGGNLMLKKVEDVLVSDLNMRPIYDLKRTK
jgi:hypothetical protein